MDIYVINLHRSSERRRRIISQLEQLGLGYTIFPAIDGAADPVNPYFSKYDNVARLRVKVRPLSKGEIACFASHYSLWEKCVQLDAPIVILEDDVLLDISLPEVLKDVQDKLGKFHYLRLGRLFDRKLLRLGNTSDGHKYVKYLKPAGGAQGYVVDPIGARLLLQHARVWLDPVDCYMDKEWVHGIPSIGIEPPCVNHVHVEGSDIGARGIESKSVRVSQKVKRELVRSYEKARDTLFNIKFIIGFIFGVRPI